MPIRILRNDITKMKSDVIVNTANPLPRFSYGCDSAIYQAAGKEELLKARREIGVIDFGEIAVTPAFNLQAKYIIHAVSCAYIDGEHGEKDILQSCYQKSLEKAVELRCHSISFPLMGTGSYHFDPQKAFKIALNTISNFLLDQDLEVNLVIFGHENVKMVQKIFSKIDSFIDENYVAKAIESEYHGTKQYKKAWKDFSLDDLTIETESDFHTYLFNLIDEKGLKDSQVYGPINVSKQTFSKIRSGRIPVKKAVLGFALTLKLNLTQTEELLSRAHYGFNPADPFDNVIKGCIENGYYDVQEINFYLEERKLDCFINY